MAHNYKSFFCSVMLVAEEAYTMSVKTCRLCAKLDDHAMCVEGEENVTKILPARMQSYLELDDIAKMAKCIRLCRECVTVLKSFQDFYEKVRTAQVVWSEITSELANKEKISVPRPRRREAKLVPFLIRGLESSRFRGLEWENRARGLFRLPWPRQGTNRWRPEDSQLFKEWAVLKGRYSDKEDFVLWKTCIRTSLHKLPNIREVREFHNFMANPPYKVYCITDFEERYNMLTRQVSEDHNYTLDSYALAMKREQNENDSDHTMDLNDSEQFDENEQSKSAKAKTAVTQIPLDNNDWCVEREETVADDDWSEKDSGSLNELPNEETVAKWIQDFKMKFTQSQTLIAEQGKRVELSNPTTSTDQSSPTRRKLERICKGKYCRDCGVRFESISALVKHRQRCDIVKNVAKITKTTKRQGQFKCEICKKLFATDESLKNHFNIHLGIRPYTCNLCMDSFFTIADLNKHKVTHSVKILSK